MKIKNRASYLQTSIKYIFISFMFSYTSRIAVLVQTKKIKVLQNQDIFKTYICSSFKINDQNSQCINSTQVAD